MLDNFGLTLAEPLDFDPHRRLVARVHDGVSKATAHLTYEANDFSIQAPITSRRLTNFFESFGFSFLQSVRVGNSTTP